MDKRKLLLITRGVEGGLGQHFVDLAEDMASRGWEVHCVRAERAEEHVTDHNARLDSLPGVTIHTIPLAREIRPSDWRSYLAFRRIVNRYGPFDIAHGHGAKGGAFVRLPCKMLGASIYTPHAFITLDPEISRVKYTLYSVIETALAWLSHAAVIAVSEQEQQEASRLGTPVQACFVIENGMKRPALLSREDARKEIGLSPNCCAALFVGRFCHQKAPERFIDLITDLFQDRPKLNGVMIGGSEGKSALIARATKLGILGRLIFFQTTKAAAYMQAADLLIIPSRYEGFAYTMIEALAAGLPIVTYDVGGASDIVKCGVNGYVVSQGDTVTFAMRTAELLDRADLRAAMATAARERFFIFSLQSMTDRIASVYHGEKMYTSRLR